MFGLRLGNIFRSGDMKDYLELYKKFNDIKDIKDLIDEVNELRHYYSTRQFDRMQGHIKKLMMKYSVETAVWNAVNCCMPTTHRQAYINAENFLQAVGAKLIIEKVSDCASRLSNDEFDFVGLMRKSV